LSAARTLAMVQGAAALIGRSPSTSSVDHLGDAEEGWRGVGGLGQNGGRHVARTGRVLSQFWVLISVLLQQDLRHWFDGGYVEFLEFADVGEDFVQLTAVKVDLFRREFEVRQLGDADDVFAANFHGQTPQKCTD
jgi:hypothetical protein